MTHNVERQSYSAPEEKEWSPLLRRKTKTKFAFLVYKSKLLSLVVTLRGADFGKKGTSRSCEHKTAGNHPPDVARERNTWPTILKSILHFYQTQVQTLSWCYFPWDQQQLHHISISKKWLQKIALTIHHFTEKKCYAFYVYILQSYLLWCWASPRILLKPENRRDTLTNIKQNNFQI